jgi:hypothetical protein
MGALAERAVELAERRQQRSGLDDRVDAEVRPRAVRGAPRHRDLRPHEPLVRDRDLQLGRLGHDRGVGAHGAQRLLDADARVLLVGDGGDHDVAGQAERRRLATGEQRGDDTRLHVVGAAAVEPVALDARLVRPRHAGHADGVEVPAQQQRPAASGPARPDEHARPPGHLLQHLDLEPGAVRPGGHERRDLRLGGAARHQVGVDRVDRDERAEQVDHVVAHVSTPARRAARRGRSRR